MGTWIAQAEKLNPKNKGIVDGGCANTFSFSRVLWGGPTSHDGIGAT
jgi:hypothetical protein